MAAEVTAIGPVSQSGAVTPVTPQTTPQSESSSTISGTIIGRDPNGNFLLKTQNGNLSVKSNLPLTYNSDLVIKVDQGTQGANARIVSVNGQPFAEFAQSLPPEADSISTALLTQSSTGSTSLTQDPQSSSLPIVVKADVLTTTPNTAASPQPQSANQVPLPAPGTVVSIHLPVTPPPPAATVQETGQILPQGGSNPQPQPAAANTPQETIIQQPVTETPAATPQASAATSQSQAAAVATNIVAGANSAATASNASKLSPSIQETTPAPAQQQESVAVPELPEAVVNTPQTSASPFYAAYARQNTTTATPANIPNAQQAVVSQSVAAPTPQSVPLQGQIISSSEDGSVTVQTPAGTITLQPQSLPASASLAPGSPILIELPQTPAQNVTATLLQAMQTLPASVGEIASSWNTVKDIIAVLNNIAGTTGDLTADDTGAPPQQFSGITNSLMSNLPVLGENFMSTSLAFITALAGGNIAKILGDDTIQTLKQNGRSDLVQKFSSEMASLAGILTPKTEHQQQANWQASFMPFIYQGEVQQARIYVKRDGQNKKQSDGKTAGGTRFIVEVDLSEFGGIQMDGLVRMKQANTVFDLMIRSRHPFSAQEQQEMTEIYNNAAAQTGFSGLLAFQTTNDFPVKPLDEILANRTSNITA